MTDIPDNVKAELNYSIVTNKNEIDNNIASINEQLINITN